MKPKQGTIIRQKLLFKVKAVEEENFIIRGVFSTGGEDRQGEIVDQNGWKLDEFMLNPVILFCHDNYQPAVGKCIELAKDGNGNLTGAIQFAGAEYDFALTLFKLYAGGFMRAFSVGFMNSKYEIDQENDTVILKENTLYEISCVNVPANSMALALSKGVDVEPITKHMLELQAAATKENEATPEQAMAALSSANIETIRTAIKRLTALLPAAPADNQVGNKGRTPQSNLGGNGKITVKILNQAVRDLLKVRKIIK